jgi:hypothetical protein
MLGPELTVCRQSPQLAKPAAGLRPAGPCVRKRNDGTIQALGSKRHSGRKQGCSLEGLGFIGLRASGFSNLSGAD